MILYSINIIIDILSSSSRASSAVATLNSTILGTVALSEKTMLAVKRLKLSKEDNAPTLDDFDREMEVYRVSIASTSSLREVSEVEIVRLFSICLLVIILTLLSLPLYSSFSLLQLLGSDLY